MPPPRASRFILSALLLAPLLALQALPGAAKSDPLIAAAGDVACPVAKPVTASTCQQAAVAALIAGLSPSAVLALGDEQYPCGSANDFAAAYDQSWGAFKAITHPVPGNHEYNNGEPGAAPTERDGKACARLASPSDAAGYFGYFGEQATPRDPTCRADCDGWYSFDLGAWHIVALNSNCGAVGCKVGSDQEQWLTADLAAHPAACTLAMWHHPRFSSGTAGASANMAAIWRDLYKAGAEIVLNGHDHDYERFAPLDADGFKASKHGVREFVVGTGGVDLHAFRPIVQSSSVARVADQFGVLTLTLHDKGYDWAFLPIGGGAPLDAGHAACHGSPAPSP